MFTRPAKSVTAKSQQTSSRRAEPASGSRVTESVDGLSMSIGNQAMLRLQQASNPAANPQLPQANHSLLNPIGKPGMGREERPSHPVIRPGASANASSTPPPGFVQEAINSQGTGLDFATRAFMEQRMGVDFSDVRLHTNERAATAAASLGAKAFAFGKNIAFADGHFSPGTDAGKRLLAHELVHVVQQGLSGSLQISLQPADDALDLKSKFDASKDAAERKPLFKQADGLLDKFVKDLATAAAADAQGQAAVNARDSLKLLLKAYMDSGLDLAELQATIPKAMNVAVASKDGEVQTSFSLQLQAFGRGDKDHLVENQQKRLAALGAFAGQQISAPGADSAAWLDKNTEAIGKTLAKIDQTGLMGNQPEMTKEPKAQGPLGIALLSNLLQDYFTLATTDIIPEPTGKVDKLQTDTSSKQILADCDVWATYGARVLRAMGWDTVGYLAINPSGRDSARSAHAVALAKKTSGSGGASYVGVSDWRIKYLGNLASDDLAIPGVLQLALNIYDPDLKSYDSYYLVAQKGGAYDKRLLDPKNNGLTPYKSIP